MLIRCGVNWTDYWGKLSRSAKKNYKASKNENSDLAYGQVEYSRRLIERYVALWQATSGKTFPEAFVDRLEKLAGKGRLLCFTSVNKIDGVLSLHVIERYGSLARCHAPWFDYELGNERSLSTFMWFSLIEWAANGDKGLFWLDLCGGPVNRLPRDDYKRRYSPEPDGNVLLVCEQCGFMTIRSISDRNPAICPECNAVASFGLVNRTLLSLARFL